MSAIDLARFRELELAPRTAKLAAPEFAALAQALGLPTEGDALLWEVRGLTGEELAAANALNERPELLVGAVEVIASRSSLKPELVGAIKDLVGLGEETPVDLAKRFDWLRMGSVDPHVDRAEAVWLFTHFPWLGYRLTNLIIELTHAGAQVKPPHSTPTPASEQP